MRRDIWWVLIVGVLWLLAGCGRRAVAQPAVTEATPVDKAGITIVAMGDSLTEGYGVEPENAYPAQLERKLRTAGYDVTVVNAGISGETSSGALARVSWVLTLQPDIVILATGGNDGLRAIDPALTKSNIDALVQKLQDAGVVVVLAGMEMVQNMGSEYTTAFHALYPAVADKHHVIFVPFLLQGVAAQRELNQADFIHPNAAGYAVVVETIYPYVVKAIGEVERGA